MRFQLSSGIHKCFCWSSPPRLGLRDEQEFPTGGEIRTSLWTSQIPKSWKDSHHPNDVSNKPTGNAHIFSISLRVSSQVELTIGHIIMPTSWNTMLMTSKNMTTHVLFLRSDPSSRFFMSWHNFKMAGMKVTALNWKVIVNIIKDSRMSDKIAV